MKTAQFKAAVNEINELWNAEDWDNMNAALMQLGKQKLTEKQAAEHLKLVARWEDYTDDEEEAEKVYSMSGQLNRYKSRYEPAMGPAGSNSSSLNNGDALAKLLDGKLPKEVCELADEFCDKPKGWHAERYERLNPGQQRMNAGNKLRALLKKGEIEVSDKGLAKSA